MGSAFTGVQEDWGKHACLICHQNHQTKHELELAFYNRPTVRARTCVFSFPLCIFTSSSLSFASADEITFSWQSFTAWKKKHFSIQLPTHTDTVYAYTHTHTYVYIVCVCALCSCGLAAAEAGVCLSRLLRSSRGWGWQRQLGSPNECLTSPGTLPSLSPRRHLEPLRLRAPHLTSRQLVPSPVWPHGLPTSPVEPVSLWFWHRLRFWGWCQGTVKGKQINRG